MFHIIDCYTKLKNDKHLSTEDCEQLLEGNDQSFQYASLIVLLLYSKPTKKEVNLVEGLFYKYPDLIQTILVPYEVELREYDFQLSYPHKIDKNNFYTNILKKTKKRVKIGEDDLSVIINQFVKNEICLNFMAAWLMLIYCYGLCNEDVYKLTELMCSSGEIFDYRNNATLNYAKTIRRYPTGALSEKTALILPSLISAISDIYNVKTPFLIAKSLSFTGGTWDKLSVIPSFYFPEPGSDTLNTLTKCSAAMTVTKGEANPADRMLYQFRSITGTVECVPLLASSIASKQLSFPVDYLLLDVRYGAGSFCGTKEMAQELADIVYSMLEKAKIKVQVLFQKTDYPNGIGIGNKLEVAEAIAIMQPNPEEFWNASFIEEQRRLVIHFFVHIMQAIYPEKKAQFWQSLAQNYFTNGKVLDAFKKLLKAHCVQEDVANNLCENPIDFFNLRQQNKYSVYSKKEGCLIGLDQKKLGNLINFHFGGKNIPNREALFLESNGVILNKTINEQVNVNDKLCDLFINQLNEQELEKICGLVRSCFLIN